MSRYAKQVLFTGIGKGCSRWASGSELMDGRHRRKSGYYRE